MGSLSSQGASVPSQWFAVRTMSRHEKKVASQLSLRGVPHFLPMSAERRLWSDREKLISTPLFPGYVFVQVVPSHEARLAVLGSAGVVSFVTRAGAPAPIPIEQIEAVRALTAENKECKSYPYIQSGQRVRMRGGSMDGMEGILLVSNKGRTLVLSIEAIGKSIAVEVHGYEFETV